MTARFIIEGSGLQKYPTPLLQECFSQLLLVTGAYPEDFALNLHVPELQVFLYKKHPVEEEYQPLYEEFLNEIVLGIQVFLPGVRIYPLQ